MGISERKKRERERIRKSIVKAAKELFYEEGFHHVSMRKIAQKIEYSPTTIYHYFKNKEEVLTQIVKEYFDDFLLEAETVLLNKAGSPFTTLHDYLMLYSLKSLQNAREYRFLTSIFSGHENMKLGSTNANIGYLHIKELLQLCLENKQIRNIDLDLATQSLWMVLYGITVLLASRPNFNWVEKETLIEFTIQSFLNSLK
jgi:AcrR family transcriptional regulator